MAIIIPGAESGPDDDSQTESTPSTGGASLISQAGAGASGGRGGSAPPDPRSGSDVGEAAGTGGSNGTDDTPVPITPGLAMFLATLADQEALTYKIDKRTQMLAAGTKAVDEWTPSAAGVGALTAPQSLESTLAGLKADLLADAPSDLARQQASADLDTHIASFLDRGQKIAQDGFKSYAQDTNTGWMNTLLGIAAQSGGDPATQQWVLDTGKASWIALGRNGLVISPEEAVQGAAQFEKDAAKAYLLGQMTTPALQNKAIAEYQSGQFDDVLGPEDKQRFDDKVAAIKAQQQADATKAQSEAHGRLAQSQGGSAADLQDRMVQDSLTLHPQILAAKYSLDQLQEQHRQGNLTTHQVSILDALRQGRVDHHVDALGRDARSPPLGLPP